MKQTCGCTLRRKAQLQDRGHSCLWQGGRKFRDARRVFLKGCGIRRSKFWTGLGYPTQVTLTYWFALPLPRAGMRKFESERCDIASFVIMPNHVHALFQLRGTTKLKPLLKAWKGTSAREINRLLGKSGALWMEESRDTSIRDPDHLVRCYGYILDNPKKAKLRAGEFLYYELPGVQRQIREWSGDMDE